MTRCPSHRPKLTRKDTAFREGIGLRHITRSNAKPSNATGRRASNLLPIMSSHALTPARLLLPSAPNSPTDARDRALSP